MAQIVVSPSQLRKKAEELRNLNRQLKTAIDELEDYEERLRQGFKGETSEAFHKAFRNDVTQMRNFYNAIEKYVINLMQIASKYEEAERDSSDIARARKYKG